MLPLLRCCRHSSYWCEMWVNCHHLVTNDPLFPSLSMMEFKASTLRSLQFKQNILTLRSRDISNVCLSVESQCVSHEHHMVDQPITSLPCQPHNPTLGLRGLERSLNPCSNGPRSQLSFFSSQTCVLTVPQSSNPLNLLWNKSSVLM